MIRKSFLLGAAGVFLLLLPAAHFIAGGSAASEDPLEVLARYLKAAYARDYREAYRHISSRDKRFKSGKVYVRERGAFTGFTLQIAERLAAGMEVAPLKTDISGDQATIALKLRLPDANKLAPHVFDWDEDRLNALSDGERMALVERLDRRMSAGQVDYVEGEETFELVREGGRWKVFLDWASGVRVAFASSVPAGSRFLAEPLQRETVVRPGDLFTIAYRVKNPSRREILARIVHRVEPEGGAEYLDVVECGLLLPVRILAGGEDEYATTYYLRGDLPEAVRRLSVTYEFQIDQD